MSIAGVASAVTAVPRHMPDGTVNLEGPHHRSRNCQFVGQSQISHAELAHIGYLASTRLHPERTQIVQFRAHLGWQIADLAGAQSGGYSRVSKSKSNHRK
jgi:hypothetical protein